MKNKNSILGRTALALFIAELLLVLLSWLLSAMMTEGVRSMLSSEGIRWFFGNFVDVLLTPQLLWILLLAMAWGTVRASRFWRKPTTYRERLAGRISLLLLVIYVLVILSLVIIPHAILLSADGGLWPSAFSRGLVPSVAFGIVLSSIVYGLMAGTLPTLDAVFQSLSQGISMSAPILVLYVLLVQLYASMLFVFM